MIDDDDIERIRRRRADSLAKGKVKPTGRAYVFIGEYPEELYA